MDCVVVDRLFPGATTAAVIRNQTLPLGLLHVLPHKPEQRSTDDRIDDGPNAETPSEADGIENGVSCWGGVWCRPS